MYNTSDNIGDGNLKSIRCFACIGREQYDNLCTNGYLRDIDPNWVFRCGVKGYNIDAIRKKDIERFNNNMHKILMTTTQCFLCENKCIYPDMHHEEIRKTITKYKEVVGII